MIQFFQDNWATIATALLGVSEALALIPFLKSNSIMQLIINSLKSVVQKKEGNL